VSEEQTEESAGEKSVWEYVDEVLAEGEPSEEELRRQWEEFYRVVNPTPADRARAESLMRDLAKPSHEDSAEAELAGPDAGVDAT